MTTKGGWIYCMSNESMPGIFKVGMTIRTPEERLTEANSSDTWRPPTEYEIAYSVRVTDAFDIETQIHKQLDDYRIHPRREFFRAPLETIKELMNRFKRPEPTKKIASIVDRSARYIHLRSGTVIDRDAV